MCGTSCSDEDTMFSERDKAIPKVGDIVSFGQTNRNWIVLEIKDDKALLLTQGIVVKIPYNEIQYEETTWRDSTLYNWINNRFINAEFEQNDLSKICLNANGEKLFLLSVSEAETFNEVLPILSCDETYGYKDFWWIQTEEEPTSYVPFVRPTERYVDTYGNGIGTHTDFVGVRLAMWIKL